MVFKPNDNIFFAVLPTEGARAAIIGVADGEDARNGRAPYRVPKDCLHLTLGGVAPGSRLTSALLRKAISAGQDAAGSPFLVELNRLESFRGASTPRVLTGEDGVIGLYRLQESLRFAMAAAGFSRGWAANFTPHLTLSRNAPAMERRFIEPIRWWVTELVLVWSHVGEGRYTTLARWPLGVVPLSA